MVAALGSFPGTAYGQAPSGAGDILWLLDHGAPADGEDIFSGIEEALATERSGHLLGDSDLMKRVEERSRPLSGCAFGIEKCGAPEAMAFDALGVGLLIRLGVDRRSQLYEISYEMVDRRGGRVSSGTVAGESAREAGFELVRQLFDAVGVVSFESIPAQAVVFVDGEEIGETPLSRQFGVGRYEYRIERPAHDAIEGTIEVRTGEAHRVDAQLEEMPGRLRISGAPEGALIWIDGENRGRAEEMVELAVGRYALEVKAEGYETQRQTVEIIADEVTDIIAELDPSRSLLRDVAATAIADHRFQFDLGLEMGFQMAAFPNARGEGDDGLNYGFEGWLDEGELVDGGELRRFLSPLGLRVGAGWEGPRLGLTFLSASMARQSVSQEVRLRQREGGPVDAVVTGLQAVHLRPMQVRYRFFYENMVPFVQGGLGVTFQRMDAELPGGEVLKLRQTDAFANLEAGLRYHFDPRWSMGVGYRMQYYFSEGLGSHHILGVSFGVGLRELPGLEPQPPGEL